MPIEWANRRVNVLQYSRFVRGGHHSSWEVPDLFAQDLRAFLLKLRAGRHLEA